MNLIELEVEFKNFFDIEEIKSNLEINFFDLINDIQHIEIKNHFDFLLENDELLLKFSGINISILDSERKHPYFLARLDIYKERTDKLIAWYDIEYGVDGEVLDDYIGFY